MRFFTEFKGVYIMCPREGDCVKTRASHSNIDISTDNNWTLFFFRLVFSSPDEYVS